MKDYTTDQPEFSASIQVVETTDPAHADNINAATKQLLQNTLVLSSILGGILAVTVNEGVLCLPRVLDTGYSDETLVLPDGVMKYDEADEEMEVSAGTITGYISGGGVGSAYVLPAATAATLGGVKIGSGIDVTEDGTISTDVEASSEAAAEVVEKEIETQIGDISQEEVESLFT